MPKCTQTQSEKFNFGRIGRTPIVANFDGGDLGADGGLLLLKSLDEQLGLTRAAARAVVDPRNPDLIEHPMSILIAQRVYANIWASYWKGGAQRSSAERIGIKRDG